MTKDVSWFEDAATSDGLLVVPHPDGRHMVFADPGRAVALDWSEVERLRDRLNNWLAKRVVSG